MGLIDGISNPIKEIGNTLDKLFTTDEERLDKETAQLRLRSMIQNHQIEINKINSESKSFFRAGWRPYIGWMCGVGISYEFIIKPILDGFGYNFPSIEISALHTLLMGMLGLGTLRTYEKVKKVK